MHTWHHAKKDTTVFKEKNSNVATDSCSLNYDDSEDANNLIYYDKNNEKLQKNKKLKTKKTTKIKNQTTT